MADVKETEIENGVTRIGEPELSVVIPLYNKAEYVARAIESVRCQTFDRFELIVVDDGSTDESVKIVTAIDDSRIRILRQDNQGPGVARNTGLRAARCAWVAFLDADDAWSDVHLEELSKLIALQPQAGLVSSTAFEIGTESNEHARLSGRHGAWSRRVGCYFSEATRSATVVHSSAVAVRRAVCDTIGFFLPLSRGEDREFWARVALRYDCVLSDRPTACYYRNTNGIMETRWNAQNRRAVPVPNSVAEMGPLAALLDDAVGDPATDDRLRASLIGLINARISTAVRINLLAGEVGRARRISRLYRAPRDRRTNALRLVLALPAPLLGAAVGGREVAKQIRSRIAGVSR